MLITNDKKEYYCVSTNDLNNYLRQLDHTPKSENIISPRINNIVKGIFQVNNEEYQKIVDKEVYDGVIALKEKLESEIKMDRIYEIESEDGKYKYYTIPSEYLKQYCLYKNAYEHLKRGNLYHYTDFKEGELINGEDKDLFIVSEEVYGEFMELVRGGIINVPIQN